MNVFGLYSQYYNLLYKEKDYQSEADFVDTLIRKYNKDAKTLLDLGCGTGKHDIALSKKYIVTGIDQSPQMLSIARQNTDAAKLTAESSNITFQQGDIRTICLDKQFDSVISLFHVMSYQTGNDDIRDVFYSVKKHLKSAGVFIFDFWYGPAVLTEKPSIRVKHMEDDAIRCTRVAQPVMHPNDNLVDVNYSLTVTDKQTQKVDELRETHRMRYLFMPEIKIVLAETGFEICEVGEWLTANEPGLDTWSVYCIVKTAK
jgi:SAM-dependent methyltransferase